MPTKHALSTKRKISASLKARNQKIREALAVAANLQKTGVVVRADE